MLNNISAEQLADTILANNPNWSAQAAKEQAAEYISQWDECLSEAVHNYLSTGFETDYKYGEFSILLIKALRHNCSYLQAVSLMDAYIKNSLNGKAMILRR